MAVFLGCILSAMSSDCNAKNVIPTIRSTVRIMDVWVNRDPKIHMNHRLHLTLRW
jgi:hypothetical protein